MSSPVTSKTESFPTVAEESKEEAKIQAPKGDDREGGVRGWCTVFGCWLILIATFGYTYTFGVFQDYYTRIYLVNDSPSKISWIGGIQLALPFFLGTISGKLFDKGYFYTLQISGALIFTFSLFMLSLAKPFQFYQIFLSQGIGMGVGFGLIFVPALAIQTHHFKRRRGLAMGVVLSGNSVGGVIFPIILNNLLKHHSFGASVRITAYIVLGILVVGNCFLRRPLSSSSIQKESGSTTDLKAIFKEPPYLLLLFNALIAGFGLYFPVIYGQLFAVQHNVDPTLAFYTLPILNGSSAIGRVIGNLLADHFGPFTILTPCTLLAGVVLWLILAISNRASLIIISILYGFFSGAYLSLVAAAIAFLSKTHKEVGVRTGILTAFTAVGGLFAAPIQGALVTRDFFWIRPIVFSASLLVCASVVGLVTRILLVKERGSQRV